MLPICRSSTTRSGSTLGERVAHVLAARDLDDFLARADERRPHLVADPLGVGGYEDRGHRGGSLDTPSRTTAGRGGARRSRASAREVVDVVREVGHVRDRRRRRPAPARPRRAARSSSRSRGSRRGSRSAAASRARGRGRRRRRAQLGRPRRAGPAGASSPKLGCTRFTISASIVWPVRASCRAKNCASSIASRRGEVTSTKRGLGCREQRLDRERAVAEAGFHPFERAEERDDVVDRLRADDTRDRAQERLHRDARDPQVRARRHHQHAEDAVVEEAEQAPGRVEEVERVAGRRRVDDDEVEVAVVVELVQLLHRHVLLRAAERAGDVAVEAVVEDALAPGRSSPRCAVTSWSNVDFVSSISAESVPPGSARAVVVPASRGRSRCGVSESVSSPSASASRLAGSIVTTHGVAALPRAFEREHRGGRRLADAAAAAADQRRGARATSALGSSDAARRRHSALDPARERVGERVDLRPADVGREQERQLDLRQRQPLAEARDLLVLHRVALGAELGRVREIVAPRARRRSARTRRRRRARPSTDAVTPSGSGSKHWLTTTGPSATPARSSIAYAVSISSLTGVSSGSVTSITWQRAGSESSATTSAACLLIGPTRTASSSPRGESRNEIAWPAAGRVDDDQIGRARPRRATSPCRARGCPSSRAPRSPRRRARPTR